MNWLRAKIVRWLMPDAEVQRMHAQMRLEALKLADGDILTARALVHFLIDGL